MRSIIWDELREMAWLASVIGGLLSCKRGLGRAPCGRISVLAVS